MLDGKIQNMLIRGVPNSNLGLSFGLKCLNNVFNGVNFEGSYKNKMVSLSREFHDKPTVDVIYYAGYQFEPDLEFTMLWEIRHRDIEITVNRKRKYFFQHLEQCYDLFQWNNAVDIDQIFIR
ncbi:uncharacterized protein LOC131929330 [Physella acuta]|uniref:uncharacterized protein LOC131929330 n=1 Tax=Physella acuta TaxID=109671 RepID=UPI0027DABAD8|nr:uncharacterized protein LOC131929330 [Physella acuta]